MRQNYPTSLHVAILQTKRQKRPELSLVSILVIIPLTKNIVNGIYH